jgi:hypothetical protein
MDAVTHPRPDQRAGPRLRPRQRRACRPGGGPRRTGQRQADRIDRTSSVAVRVQGKGKAAKVVQPHAHRKVLGTLRTARRPRPGSHRRRHGRCPGLARPLLRRPRRDPAQGRRSARRPVAGPDQRRDHAGTEQDGIPGRDRQRPASSSTSGASTSTSRGRSSPSSRPRTRGASGTAPTTARSRASSTP